MKKVVPTTQVNIYSAIIKGVYCFQGSILQGDRFFLFGATIPDSRPLCLFLCEVNTAMPNALLEVNPGLVSVLSRFVQSAIDHYKKRISFEGSESFRIKPGAFRESTLDLLGPSTCLAF